MKQLDRDHLARVTRELDECPALKQWLVESRTENREYLEACPLEEALHLQGQNSTINQVLDKAVGLE